MPEVFLSHKSEEKKAAKGIKSLLDSHLIEVWLDEESLQVGDVLSESLMKNIQDCPIFLAQISLRYVQSRWCMEELKLAHALNKKILFVFEDEPALVKKEGNVLVNSIASTNLYSEVDKYDRIKSQIEILNAINKTKQVRFSTEAIELHSLPVIHIKVDNDRELSDDFLKSWGFNILNFLAKNQDDPEIIKPNQIVAFSGPMPQWLVAYLTIPLFNKRNVLVYNKPATCFICVYAQKSDKHLLGNHFPFVV